MYILTNYLVYKYEILYNTYTYCLRYKINEVIIYYAE